VYPSGKFYYRYSGRSPKIRLWPIGDMHFGNRGFAEDHFRCDMKAIEQDPHSMVIGMGDYADFVGINDKRFDPAVFPDDMRVKDLGDLSHYYGEKIKELFWRVRGKCIGLMEGNHEHTFKVKQEQHKMVEWMCHELGVPYLGYSCMFHLVLCGNNNSRLPVGLWPGSPPRDETGHRWPITVFCHHGAGAPGTAGGKMNRLVKFMNDFVSDLVLTAHNHDPLPKRIPRLSLDAKGEHVKEKLQYGLVAGSYLRGYAEGEPGYVEIKGLTPVTLGAVPINLYPAQQRISSEV